MKTERVVLLTTPEFKAFLSLEAQRAGVSVAELVRSQFNRSPNEDEEMLVALTGELRKAVASAKKSVQAGLLEVDSVLAELRAKKMPETVKRTKRAKSTAERLAA